MLRRRLASQDRRNSKADRITCQAPGAVVFDMSAAATSPRIPEQSEAPAVEAIVDAVAGLGVGHPHAS